jgi:ribosomal 50S subunit-recycling heat shock protein
MDTPGYNGNGGKVDVNGDRAKRAKQIQAGDTVRLRQGPVEWVLVVREAAGRRGSAEIAGSMTRPKKGAASVKP